VANGYRGKRLVRDRLHRREGRESFTLDSPTKGLLIGNLIWHEMRDFSPDCVLVVLASEPYDEADYIRDYDEFRHSARLLRSG
jgi:hypothetical protein